MKSALFYGPRDVRVGEMADSEPGPGEVVIDVKAATICGSDLHSYLLGNVGGAIAPEPFTLGHEASGVIAALGPRVRESHPHLRVGTRVAIDPATPCRTCEFCLKGDPNLCTRLKFLGIHPAHGAMRERMTHAARSVVPMPDSITDEGAAMLEPLGVALHGVQLGQVQVGDDVLVIGCGGVGLLIVRLARLAGARHVFAVDVHPWRLAIAANYGADMIIDTARVDVVDEVMRRTNGRGVDVAIEAAWVKDTAAQCVEAARHGGRVVIVGIPAEDELTMKASTPRRKELMIVSSRRMKHTYPPSIALVASGQVDLDALATHHYTLDQASAAFETAANYADGVVRAVITPGKH
jgi:L-iditol 2-dehydrogenase